MRFRALFGACPRSVPAVTLLLATALALGQPSAPNLTGLPLDSARTLARAAGLRVQSMPSRDQVHHDFVDAASFGDGVARLNWKYQVHEMPGVVGLALAEAESALVVAGFALGGTRGERWELLERRRYLRIVTHGYTSGVVVRQEPAPGGVRGLPPLELTLGLPPSPAEEPGRFAGILTEVPLDSARILLGTRGPVLVIETVPGTGYHDLVLDAQMIRDTAYLRWAAQGHEIPDLGGLMLGEARRALVEAGFGAGIDSIAPWAELDRAVFLRLVPRGDTTGRIVRQRPGHGAVTGLPRLELWFGVRQTRGWFWPWGALGLAAVLILVLVVLGIARSGSARAYELPPVPDAAVGAAGPAAVNPEELRGAMRQMTESLVRLRQEVDRLGVDSGELAALSGRVARLRVRADGGPQAEVEELEHERQRLAQELEALARKLKEDS